MAQCTCYLIKGCRYCLYTESPGVGFMCATVLLCTVVTANMVVFVCCFVPLLGFAHFYEAYLSR